MTAEDTAEPALAITEQAIEKVRGFRAQSGDPESQALWVEVSGVSDGEYVYKISLNALHVARQGDVVQRHGDLAIVVPKSSVEKLRGDHHLGVQGPGRVEEFARAVGGGGQQEEDSGHRCIVSRDGLASASDYQPAVPDTA